MPQLLVKLLVLLLRPVVGFHVWWDGSNAIGELYYPGTTEQCALPCPAGYGCVILNDTTACGKCDRDAVSAEGSTWCRSCSYTDASSSGLWSSEVKKFLTASEDNSQCEFELTATNICGKAFYVGLLGLFASLFAITFTSVLCRELRLHRVIRKGAWIVAKEIIDDHDSTAPRMILCFKCKPQSGAQLVNTGGMDFCTPLELALKWGEMNSVSLIETERDVVAWRELVNAMLEQHHHPRQSESDEGSTLSCCCSKEVALHLISWLIAIVWFLEVLIPYSTVAGALLDQGNFAGISKMEPPSTLQECDKWCTTALFVSIVPLIVLVIIQFLLFSYIKELSRPVFNVVWQSSDVSTIVGFLTLSSAGVGSWIGAAFDGGGMITFGFNGVATGILIPAFLGWILGPTLVKRYMLKNLDPYESSLKRLLRQDKHSAEVLWPLVRKCISPEVWALILPKKNIDKHTKDRAVEIATALARNARSIEESARVLHTLIEAHIAGIVDPDVCAQCIAQVASLNPKARLFRGKEKSTPAEMALQSAKSTDVKRAALIVLFDRFAIVDVEERIYESATCRVYRAEDIESGDIVAIKLFAGRDHYEKEIEMRDALGFDADVDGGLAKSVVADIKRYEYSDVERDRRRENPDWKHAIIDPLYDSFGSGAVVMPLADFDLNTRLSLTRIAGIDAEACVSIIRPIVAALAKLHDIGIVHADVKPRNVVYVDETWKLIDLDAAQKIGDAIDTAAEDFKWTSGFASPELARCWTAEPKGTLVADPKMDVFSLGVLMFELLTGHPLFLQDTCNNDIIDSAYVFTFVVRTVCSFAIETNLFAFSLLSLLFTTVSAINSG